MTSTNYNKLLVSLTDRIMVWMNEEHDQPGVRVPYIGNNTASHMATAAMNVLASIDDLYDTLVENGEIEEGNEP